MRVRDGGFFFPHLEGRRLCLETFLITVSFVCILIFFVWWKFWECGVQVASTELGGGGGGGVGNIDGGGRDDGKDEGSSGGDGMEAILAFCAERGISLDKVRTCRIVAAIRSLL